MIWLCVRVFVRPARPVPCVEGSVQACARGLPLNKQSSLHPHLGAVQREGVFPQDLLSRQAPARVVGWGRTLPA